MSVFICILPFLCSGLFFQRKQIPMICIFCQTDITWIVSDVNRSRIVDVSFFVVHKAKGEHCALLDTLCGCARRENSCWKP